MDPINADILAGKLHAIRNGDYPRQAEQLAANPRLVELLWFIQWVSWQPNGLRGLAITLRERFGEQTGPKIIRQFGWPKDDAWSAEQCFAVWKEVLLENDWECSYRFPEFFQWAGYNIDPKWTVKILLENTCNREKIERGLVAFNFGYFDATVLGAVEEKLPWLLRSFCADQGIDFSAPWYFPGLIGCLLQYMDEWEKDTRRGIGSTKVSEKVFQTLDFGIKKKCPVMILGDSRVGKTTSIFAWCRMRPGLARLVTVPSNNGQWEFIAAHAEALGIDFSEKASERKIRQRVQYALQHSGLFVVYDESHFLLPANYSRNTPPKRLDWVRCEVIDRNLGVAFFATRQTYHKAMDQYVKTTRHQMEQWTGRVVVPGFLPTEFDEVEMLSAAKVKFPALDEDFLGIIVDECIKTETGFQYMEALVKFSCFQAERAGRSEPSLEDIQTAFRDILYAGQDRPSTGAKTKQEPNPRGRRGGVAGPSQPTRRGGAAAVPCEVGESNEFAGSRLADRARISDLEPQPIAV